MTKDYDNFLENVVKLLRTVREEPGLGFLFGFSLGLVIRELTDIVQILRIWLRKFLIGERRKP